MNTLSVDTLRVDIFKKLVNLDHDKLVDVYKYVQKLASKESEETLVLQKILDATADYAVRLHKQGDFRTTQEVMAYVGEEMGWM